MWEFITPHPVYWCYNNVIIYFSFFYTINIVHFIQFLKVVYNTRISMEIVLKIFKINTFNFYDTDVFIFPIFS